MPIAQFLFGLLVTGAELATSSAVSAFAQGAGKAAFEALKKRLAERHDVKSLSQLDQATSDTNLQAAIKMELAKTDIAGDAEVLRLARTVWQAIAALPQEVQMRHAVEIEEIRAGAALVFDDVEGVKARRVVSKGDMTFSNVKAPPGKP